MSVLLLTTCAVLILSIGDASVYPTPSVQAEAANSFHAVNSTVITSTQTDNRRLLSLVIVLGFLAALLFVSLTIFFFYLFTSKSKKNKSGTWRQKRPSSITDESVERVHESRRPQKHRSQSPTFCVQYGEMQTTPTIQPTPNAQAAEPVVERRTFVCVDGDWKEVNDAGALTDFGVKSVSDSSQSESSQAHSPQPQHSFCCLPSGVAK